MDSIFEKRYTVTPEYCDARAGLSPLAAFTMFQAVASQHAELLGVGGEAMTRLGEFWLTVHTRVDFFAPARLMDELTARTWAERCDPKDIRCYRSYTLDRGETRIAAGKTEWAILGPKKKLISFGRSNFPADYAFPARSAIDARPQRFRDNFDESDLFMRRAVRSTDIDFGRHMNNVAYVRLLLDSFSARELASGAIRSFEIHYCTPCMEGEMLSVYKKQIGGNAAFCVRKEDGKTAALALAVLREEV